MSDEKLINWLFETNAFRVCPENEPFWYTSGTIGPYYINTHFLYGSESSALELLRTIDDLKQDRLRCPERLLAVMEERYAGNTVYRGVIDSLLDFIKDNVDTDTVDYVSGGERRDWFFSLLAAKGLGKPHLTIYKDLSAVITENGATRAADSINGARVLHIADLITEASSYERAWIPAIKNLCGRMTCTVVIVDRMQGGSGVLEKHEVRTFAMVSIGKSFFDKALEMGRINHAQYDMLLKYASDPHGSMKAFLEEHPWFIEKALNSDERTRERARLCIENGIYR
ncbi:MAG TPA: orotate phosphoribosyltransferase [Clostridiales bacterium]|nr:orotate phosphoribosyltransferase [Clostridiales bacterium]HPV01503.1 orotate phosphoribosyltransferase [Clostridiales bacterium]